MPMIANTIMKIDSFIRKGKKKMCRQQMEAMLGSVPVTLQSASRALGWGPGDLSSLETSGCY